MNRPKQIPKPILASSLQDQPCSNFPGTPGGESLVFLLQTEAIFTPFCPRGLSKPMGSIQVTFLAATLPQPTLRVQPLQASAK